VRFLPYLLSCSFVEDLYDLLGHEVPTCVLDVEFVALGTGLRLTRHVVVGVEVGRAAKGIAHHLRVDLNLGEQLPQHALTN
jgi:hypothetical protein